MSTTAPGTPGDAAAAAASTAAATAAADAAAVQAAADAAAAAGGNGAPVVVDGEQGDESPWTDPDKAKREIERLRRENGDARINAKKTAADEARTELLATLTKALNPESAGPALTPEQLTEKLTESGSALDASTKERAMLQEAWKLGLNPAKLDYLSYQLSRNPEYTGIDASGADLGSKIASVISSEVAKDSSLKLSGAAIGSGVETIGGANGASTTTKAEFDKMPYSERVNLYNTNKTEYDRLNTL